MSLVVAPLPGSVDSCRDTAGRLGLLRDAVGDASALLTRRAGVDAGDFGGRAGDQYRHSCARLAVAARSLTVRLGTLRAALLAYADALATAQREMDHACALARRHALLAGTLLLPPDPQSPASRVAHAETTRLATAAYARRDLALEAWWEALARPWLDPDGGSPAGGEPGRDDPGHGESDPGSASAGSGGAPTPGAERGQVGANPASGPGPEHRDPTLREVPHPPTDRGPWFPPPWLADRLPPSIDPHVWWGRPRGEAFQQWLADLLAERRRTDEAGLTTPAQGPVPEGATHFFCGGGDGTGRGDWDDGLPAELPWSFLPTTGGAAR